MRVKIETGGRRGKDGLPIPATPKEIKAARRSTALTREEFARVLGVMPEVVKAWEEGTLLPNGVASKLVRVLIKHPQYAAELAEL